MLQNRELLVRSFDCGIGLLVESTRPDEIQDDEIREDWEQAKFFLGRIMRRLTQTGEFSHVGT